MHQEINYSAFGGTSAASPYAAGVVACLQSAAKTLRGNYLSPSEVRTILTSTGENIATAKIWLLQNLVSTWSGQLIVSSTSHPQPKY